MTLRTPEKILKCVKSTVFAEVELTHDWTLQPPLAAYLDIHRSISVCSCCDASLNDASLNEEYAGNALFRAFLTCADGTHVYWRTNGDGNSGVIGAQLCKWPSMVYGRVCRGCGHPAQDDIYYSRCATR